MDPQQRVALRVSWRALENSGINPDDLAGHDVGCYVGASVTGYGPDLADFSDLTGHLITGTALGVISGRVAYTLGLAGPALTIDASCASALAAFHVAVQAVRTGDCDLALAGGVCVMGSPGFFVEFSRQHALSDDGHCRPYSAQASGTVWAEGAAMFVLQRKSAALRAGRRIFAEVLTTKVNQDGHSAGLTAPNGSAQSALFRNALRTAVRPAGSGRDDRGPRHRHATGRPHRTAFSRPDLRRAHRPEPAPCSGSVKSNIGHAQAAAGALGLAKAVIAAEHGAVPPSLHTEEASSEIDWESQGLRLARELDALAGR